MRNKSFVEHQFSIVNQSNCYQMCYRISKFVNISSDMGDTGINVIL